VQTP
jgi:hypothetical protein